MLTIKIHYSRHFPPLFLLSSSYRPPIVLLSIPYWSRIDPVSEYGNNTETIRDWYGNDTEKIEGTREKLKKSKVKNTLTKPVHEHGVKRQRRRITKRLSWLHFNHWALGSSVVVGESLGRRNNCVLIMHLLCKTQVNGLFHDDVFFVVAAHVNTCVGQTGDAAAL